ncbi:MAG: hypothetical protein WDW38_007378 [Sanguina aurantia]
MMLTPIVGDSAHSGKAFLTGQSQNFEFVDSADLEARGSRKNANLGQGSWWHATYHLATTIATPAAYAALPNAFSGMGWIGGVICLFCGWTLSCYNSLLLCTMFNHNGKRHERYAHLAREIYGEPGYWMVTFFQQIASLGNNVAVEIAAGLAMQSIYMIYMPDGLMTLQHFIIIFAAFQLILSQLPDIHSLTYLNILCTVCTVGFAFTCLGLSVANGNELDRSTVTYAVLDQQDPAPVVFTVLASLGVISFAFGDTILPEIQATLKAPTIRNMQLGVLSAYGIIGVTYFIVACAGYWAFGYGVPVYLPQSFTDPNWALVLVNIFAIVQIAGCFQIYCRPTYEWASLKFEDPTQGPWSRHNIISRFGVTFTYSCLMTLVSCAVPFFGDFVALVGAMGFTPLDFVLPLLFFNAVNPDAPRLLRMFHYFIAACYSSVALLGFIGAVRWISVHIETYR